MRKYNNGKNRKLLNVKCNMCGKELQMKNDVLTEGALIVDFTWNYFSNKDGEIHSFDMCEECYDDIIKKFKIPVDIEKKTELM
ncbi:MAG: hypothetical protein IIX45_03320 [Lachnospiraceae bacterium]|nr:hypothetical protein [Lachnospiraceae bacterium]